MFLDSFFHEQARMLNAFNHAFLRPRAVRYGILVSHAGIDTLEELKAKAQAKIDALQAYIQELEELSESMSETPKQSKTACMQPEGALDDTETNEAKPKAGAKTKRKQANSKQAKGK